MLRRFSISVAPCFRWECLTIHPPGSGFVIANVFQPLMVLVRSGRGQPQLPPGLVPEGEVGATRPLTERPLHNDELVWAKAWGRSADTPSGDRISGYPEVDKKRTRCEE